MRSRGISRLISVQRTLKAQARPEGSRGLLLQAMILAVGVMIGLFFCPSASAACSGASPTWTAASAAQTDVQACVTIAVNGDYIKVPAGTAAYSSSISIPTTKCITIDGQGAVTLTASNVGFIINPGTTCESRVTGFSFTGGSGNQTSANIQIYTSTPGAAVSFTCRVDHNTFTNGSIYFYVFGVGPVLVDHNTLTAGGAAEMMHVLGENFGGNAAWRDNIYPGGPNMVFVEDNTFNGASGATSAIQGYSGSRMVIRHNTLNTAQIDQHGTAGYEGVRWWEIYNNVFNNNNTNQCCYADLRAGSGVWFGNTVVGNGSGSNRVSVREEDSNTWPQSYQIGSGINGFTDAHNSCAGGTLNSSPAYFWAMDPQFVINPGGSVQLNRDYFVSTAQPASLSRQQQTGDSCSTTYNYVPYTYPHPLQQGTSVAPPTSLSAVIQ